MPARERGGSPAGFRGQLLARLRNQAHSSQVAAQRLQQRVAFERFLARLEGSDDWVLKSGFARLAGESFARFHIDLSSGDALVAVPDTLEGSDLLAFADIKPLRFLVYPVVQHLAEKVHAYTLPRDDLNTRVKDLIDLVILASLEAVEGEALLAAVRATFAARASHVLPARLPNPPPAWAAPYGRLSGESPLASVPDLEGGFVLAMAFWQPLLDGGVTGRRWDPQQRVWLSKA